MGTRVLGDLQAVGEHGPVPLAADRDRLPLSPAVGHRDQVLVPGLGPSRGSAELPRHPGHQRVLGVGAELRAEGAADVRGDDVHLLRLEAEQPGQATLGALRALVGYPRGHPPVLAPHGRAGSGLHRGRRDPLVQDRPRGHDLALVEQVLVELAGIAEVRGHVGARLLVEEHLVGRRVGEVDHGGQHVVVDVHEFDRVLALIGLLGDHDRHRFADEADLVGRQDPPGHLLVEQRPGLDLGQLCEVGAGEHGDDPGGLPRGADVDGLDPGVRDGGASEEHVAGTCQALVHDVLCVDAATGQEARILGPQDASTQDAHRRSAPLGPRCRPPQRVGYRTAVLLVTPGDAAAGWRANAALHLRDDRACRAPGRSNRPSPPATCRDGSTGVPIPPQATPSM